MQNIFGPRVSEEVVAIIHKLNPDSRPLWGKMNVAQMLAPCNVTHEMVYTDKHPRPNGTIRFILKLFVKPAVVNERPCKKNIRTAPSFIISDKRDFEPETVYGGTRIPTKPENYILDQDHHVYPANRSINFNWQFYAEILFFKS